MKKNFIICLLLCVSFVARAQESILALPMGEISRVLYIDTTGNDMRTVHGFHIDTAFVDVMETKEVQGQDGRLWSLHIVKGRFLTRTGPTVSFELQQYAEDYEGRTRLQITLGSVTQYFEGPLEFRPLETGSWGYQFPYLDTAIQDLNSFNPTNAIIADAIQLVFD